MADLELVNYGKGWVWLRPERRCDNCGVATCHLAPSADNAGEMVCPNCLYAESDEPR